MANKTNKLSKKQLKEFIESINSDEKAKNRFINNLAKYCINLEKSNNKLCKDIKKLQSKIDLLINRLI